MALSTLLLLIGFIVLVKGADFLVNGASSLAKKFHISDIAIGLTVVSLGTSSPELLISITSSLKGHTSAAFGNIIGSNIANLLLILGVSGIVYPLMVQRNTIRYEVPISLAAPMLLYILLNDVRIWGSEINQLSRIDALILMFVFGLFILYIFRTMSRKSNIETGGKGIKIYPVLKSIAYILLGLGMLAGGGTLVVDHAVIIAEYFNLSHRIIGLTILAVGTSLPELATSVVAAYRRNTDIAIGNVIGSNIFNILFILGVTGLINPLEFNPSLNFDIYVLIGSTLALLIFMFTLTQSKLDRWEAILLFVGYITYLLYIIGVGN